MTDDHIDDMGYGEIDDAPNTCLYCQDAEATECFASGDIPQLCKRCATDIYS